MRGTTGRRKVRLPGVARGLVLFLSPASEHPAYTFKTAREGSGLGLSHRHVFNLFFCHSNKSASFMATAVCCIDWMRRNVSVSVLKNPPMKFRNDSSSQTKTRIRKQSMTIAVKFGARQSHNYRTLCVIFKSLTLLICKIRKSLPE